ncbi:hypothetical protein RJT34_18304 [Clitoria ternatea]|uniref:Uncharacterized protein n=1 Tax=Clitoria ternatea TaxID=43366 RepID=A0AAN9PFP5_CLITE
MTGGLGCVRSERLAEFRWHGRCRADEARGIGGRILQGRASVSVRAVESARFRVVFSIAKSGEMGQGNN